MSLPAFEYVRPESLQDATSFLKTHANEAMILGGGTDLLVSMKRRLFRPKFIVDLKQLPDLQHFGFDESEGLVIGASTRLLDLGRDETVFNLYPAISEAARSVAAMAQQTMGTIGGNLCLDTRCWYFNQSEMWRRTLGPCFKLEGDACFVVKGASQCSANYSGDTAPAFMVLGSEIKIADPDGVRVEPLDVLYTGEGKRPISLSAGEILVEVRVPPPQIGIGSAYRKYRLRERVDFPLAGVAAALFLDDRKICVKASVSMTAVGCAPERSQEAEKALLGKTLTTDVIAQAAKAARDQARPLKTTVMPPPHRKNMVEMLARDAIEAAASRCSSLETEEVRQ